MSITILLAEGHKMMREAIRALLEKEADIEVVGEAEEGRTTIQLVRKLKPNLVIMDPDLPEDGPEATRQIGAEAPGTKVLALSMHADKRFVEEMLTAGASGYLLKDHAAEDLVATIYAVAANRTYLGTGIKKKTNK